MEAIKRNQENKVNLEVNQDNIWFSSQRLLSYNCTLNFIVGNRGGGKTIEMMRLITSTFVKKKLTSIWLRRYDVELDNTFIEKFFTDPAFYLQFPDYDFKAKKTKYGGVGYIKRKNTELWLPYIQFMCLSTALKHKSIPFPDVQYIIYDEFIIDQKSNMRYLKNEVTTFLEFLQSVMRLRENVRCLFVGNSISVINPYFLYYNIKRPTEEFTKKGNCCVQYYSNPEYTKRLRNSRFGELVKGTSYADYAIDNKFFRDNECFVEKRSKNARYWYSLKYDDVYLSVWVDAKNQTYYIDDAYDKNKVCFTMTTDDHNIDTIMVKSAKAYYPLQALVQAFEFGRVRLKTMKLQAIFLDILYLIS